ncbi:hypothetical protein HED51_22545 [Ochrobactrum grignonense]|nr:hypothetical protein [Brucella grignonensis]
MLASFSESDGIECDRPVGSFAEAERQAVIRALSAERGNLSKVARRLGISRPTLYRNWSSLASSENTLDAKLLQFLHRVSWKR